MTRNKVFLLFVPVILALALLLGVNWTIRPVQASGPLEQQAPVLLGSLAQYPKLERVTVRGEVEGPRAPEAVCSVPSVTPDYTGRVVYFPLDENAGATSFTSDVGGLTLTGTCDGDKCPTKTTGKVQGAFDFTAGDQITVPYHTVTDWGIEQDFSLEVWVNFTAACDEREVFLGKYRGSDPTNYNSWWVGCDAGTNKAAFNLRSSGYISSTLQVDTDSLTISGGPALNDGKWHHVVAVHDAISTTEVLADTNYLYVDGSEVATGEWNYFDDFTGDGDLNLGWYNTDPAHLYHYQGVLDEAAIYNKVLSPSQVLSHWQDNCNVAPVAVDDNLTTSEDTALTIQVATLKANDSDPNGDAFTLTAGGSTTQGGTVSPTGNGPWTYTPKAGFSGADTFTYTATDPRGAADTATVTVTVTSVNSPPTAVDDSLATNEDTPLTIQVSDLKGNDSDVDAGDTFTLTMGGSTTQGGSVTGTGPWTYTPKANFSETDTFTYTATDSHSATSTATVTVTVAPVNDPPQVNIPGGKTNQVGDTIVPVQISATDIDGDDLTFSATNLPGGLSMNQTTGVISGTVAATAKGDYLVKVTVTDGKAPVTVEFTWVIGVPKVYLPLLLRNAGQGG